MATAPSPASSGEPEVVASSRRKALLVGLVVVGWLGVQLGVPLVRMVERGGGERPRTFGWQMFSHELTEPAEQFTITTANGSRVIDLGEFIELSSPMRRELLYAPTVIPILCENPAILSVEVRDAEWGTSVVSCR
jgi:hypothetical protein